jgi:hypothetical protein
MYLLFFIYLIGQSISDPLIITSNAFIILCLFEPNYVIIIIIEECYLFRYTYLVKEQSRLGEKNVLTEKFSVLGI